jgi:hypothetical protein
MREELGFWVTVGIVAVVTIALFKLAAASKLGEAIPALGTLGAFV